MYNIDCDGDFTYWDLVEKYLKNWDTYFAVKLHLHEKTHLLAQAFVILTIKRNHNDDVHCWIRNCITAARKFQRLRENYQNKLMADTTIQTFFHSKFYTFSANFSVATMSFSSLTLFSAAIYLDVTTSMAMTAGTISCTDTNVLVSYASTTESSLIFLVSNLSFSYLAIQNWVKCISLITALCCAEEVLCSASFFFLFLFLPLPPLMMTNQMGN